MIKTIFVIMIILMSSMQLTFNILTYRKKLIGIDDMK